MILVELFSGIGGFAKGLMDAGVSITKHYFSEIDKHAIANYKYNFPNAEYIGSVINVSGTEIRNKHPHEKIIVTFGWPCQDNSIAGKRKGQKKGTRSGLLFEAGRIIAECKCEHFIAENVKGLYSVNAGVDFYEAVIFLTYLNSDSPQYTVEMQLLNTAWVLPQNRERTYFVGHLGTMGIKRIFPVGESNCGINVGNKTNETTTVKTISAGGNSGGQHSGMTLVFSDRGESGKTICKEEIIGALSSRSGASHDHAVLRTEALLNKSQDGKINNKKSVSQTLNSGHYNVPKIIQPVCVAMRGRNHENPSDRTVVAPTKQRLEPNSQGTTNTLTGVQKDNLLAYDFKTVSGKSKTRRGGIKENETSTLDSNCNIGTNQYNKIRRLTEIECERLQGFPDNWTAFGNYDGVIKPIPKTQRYKLIGNAVTKNIVQMIGEKI